MAEKRKLNLRKAEPGAAAARASVPPWPLLVVDDDRHVHEMTRVVLRDFTFQGRGFEMVEAASAAEAREVLEQRPDIPVMLLDVVMETDQSGLTLARHVRETMGNHALRIILRTGQPGDAPEREVMEAYDINDYRAKTELTAQKLFTAVAGALRSWQNIDAVQRANELLEQRVAERTRELHDARRFAENLLEMLPSPVWYKGTDGDFRLVNRAFRHLFGDDAGALARELAEREAECDARLANGPRAEVAYEAALDGSDGRPRTIVVTKGAVLGDDGTLDGILGVATDISERKALESELRRLATTDPLTNLANRRHFMAVAGQEFERSVRYRRALSLIMLDVDHFKRINDTFGHACGDEVLVAVAKACASGLRDCDMLGRLGGEEFAVLLPETDLDGAVEVAERLRRAVAATPVPVGRQDIVMTISLGVGALVPGDVAVHHVLARADAALYHAKEQGRDRVVAQE